MKIVINKCYGGFSLSPLAIKRMAELQGRKCFFFRDLVLKKDRIRKPITLEEACRDFFFDAFDTDDLSFLSKPKDWFEMSEEEKHAFNEAYEKHHLTDRPDDRTDPLLIQVVEELGAEADGKCAQLQVVEVPDGIEWELDEYDGIESIAEKHKTWG